MKAAILAGGFGSRLGDETADKPKPMVEIGGKPILWHIMSLLGAHGITEFVIALGYKGDVIKDYFRNFSALSYDLSVDLATGKTIYHTPHLPDWKVHLVDTGVHTQTGGRVKRLAPWLRDDEPFLLTYADGVADINIRSLFKFHQSHGKMATVTTVRAPARFGRVTFEGDRITDFQEKTPENEGWINGGFFVLDPSVMDYIDDDETVWERAPVERLAREQQLMGYQHHGFWSCMDTPEERQALESLWCLGNAPWRTWTTGDR